LTNVLAIRVVLVLLMGGVGFALPPFALPAPAAAAAGLAIGLLACFIEHCLGRAPAARLAGAALGTLCGLISATLVTVILLFAVDAGSTRAFLSIVATLLLGYLGFMLGSSKADGFRMAGTSASTEKELAHPGLSILDTSVIIDGRIADIAETGFLAGTIAIPQFVLRELQLVADSADSLKRQRGRRGLDILQRLQKMPELGVKILEDDFPNIRDVDMKLVQLGKNYGAKVMTNDFNLNKVAQLHGVEILNINELANALKPIVLPGETMRVFILKEGKEYNQGVAYLDDGTMVVVDNARKLISKTIDIAVTSVLQTTAGKMIFGRFDERSHAVYEKSVPPPHTTAATKV
jgi:uncharacterized protein YacL